LKTLPSIVAGFFLIIPFPSAAVCADSSMAEQCLSSKGATARERQQPTEVPFKVYRGYAVVARGSIGNLSDLQFLIDTGASPSVLDQRIARKLHLKREEADLSVFTKRVRTEQAVAPNVQIGPLHVPELRVAVQDLSFVRDALGTKIDAMIGFDLLGQASFTIDYELRKIAFGSIDPSFTAVPYHPGLPYAVVDLEIGGERLGILVDTGASDLVLFGNRIQNSRPSIRRVGERTWSNMGGELRVQEAELTEGRLGPISFAGRKAYILENGSQQTAGLAGMLGTVALKARRIGFDPTRRVMAWE
jgi:predicted aspartyl protease